MERKTVTGKTLSWHPIEKQRPDQGLKELTSEATEDEIDVEIVSITHEERAGFKIWYLYSKKDIDANRGDHG